MTEFEMAQMQLTPPQLCTEFDAYKEQYTLLAFHVRR